MAMLDIVGVYESDKQWRLKGVPNISLGSVHVDVGICLIPISKILDLLASHLPLWSMIAIATVPHTCRPSLGQYSPQDYVEHA